MKSEMQEKILQYYVGKLPRDETVEMFRELVKTEEIWHLPGNFLDTAASLLEAGLIGPPRSLRGLDT